MKEESNTERGKAKAQEAESRQEGKNDRWKNTKEKTEQNRKAKKRRVGRMQERKVMR